MPGDRRLHGKEWKENPLFDYFKQSYLLASNTLHECADATTLGEEDKDKLKFYTRQLIDAMSPSNFVALNPEVIQQAVDSKGQSPVDGMNDLMADMEKGRISMTDEAAFTLGENIATTEGGVVYEKATFKTKDLFAGPVEYVLGASGQIAGVINPPHKHKRHYWFDGERTSDPERWLDTATREQGSWWAHWDKWLHAQGGSKRAAPKTLGNKDFQPIEPAPGRYVKKRAS